MLEASVLHAHAGGAPATGGKGARGGKGRIAREQFKGFYKKRGLQTQNRLSTVA